jgi:phosphate-selective porin OprO/OprP
MEKKDLIVLSSGLAVCAALATTPAYAANDAMQELLKVLKDKGTLDPATYEQLKSAAQADDEQNTQGQAEIKSAASSLPKIETKGKLEWGTPDGEFSWRLGGRLHLDTAFYDNDDGTTLTSGTDIRRARIETTATLWRNWFLKFVYDFAGVSEVRDGFRDMYLGYKLKTPWPVSFTAGQFKEYYGLESLTSSNDTTFMERAMGSRLFHDIAEGSDGRRLGFGASTFGHDLWTAHLGVFGKSANASVENADGDVISASDDNVADPLVFNGRLTVAPIHTEKTVVHLGFAGSWIDSKEEGGRIRFRARPDARIGADRLVDTGTIDGGDTVGRYAAEAAFIYGPVSVQGEYLHADVSRIGTGTEDLGFDAWYAFASWIISGESRVYDFEQGVFKNPKPYGVVGKGGIGAWEIAARYDGVNLTDEDILGGREENLTAGLNWYPTPNFKFMANYVHVLPIDDVQNDAANPDVFQFRAQAYW